METFPIPMFLFGWLSLPLSPNPNASHPISAEFLSQGRLYAGHPLTSSALRRECQRAALPSASWKESQPRPSEPPVPHVTTVAVPGASQGHSCCCIPVYLIWCWMQIMPETCPASGSFGEPNFRNVFLLSVLSSNTGQKVSAEHFPSRRGKSHKVQVHLRLW